MSHVFRRGDRVRDTMWGGTFTGTVVTDQDPGDLNVTNTYPPDAGRMLTLVDDCS